ncbi:hypothetical protein LEN26_011873 [Aphanomyces euteiches]|nr:hypothetical protein AeMF1_015323 [Aphanomyces euteiches]KAH9118945.1 hypothetical protein LEN26_011873 [Aphanomyces euteiches]KAH9189848.1 hypothetical protein AeNC1_008174 [Aphanomyces euteiches]
MFFAVYGYLAVGVVDKSLVGLWLQTALVFVVIGVAVVALWYMFAVDAILNLSFSQDNPVVFGSLFPRIMALALFPQLPFCALSAYLASFDVKKTRVPSAQTSVVQRLLDSSTCGAVQCCLLVSAMMPTIIYLVYVAVNCWRDHCEGCLHATNHGTLVFAANNTCHSPMFSRCKT